MKLEPCPFCGSDDTTPVHTRVSDDAQWWNCRCNICLAQCEYKPTEAEAIAAWNRRPQPTSQSDEALVEDFERNLRILLWNAAMSGGMGQDLSLALVNRGMVDPLASRILTAYAEVLRRSHHPIRRNVAALVEELAKTCCRARYGEEIGWQGFLPEANEILPILHRERADAFDAGVCSTFEQRAMDLRDVREAGRREGIEEAAKVCLEHDWGGKAYDAIRALAEKQP